MTESTKDYRLVQLINNADESYHIIRKGGDETLCGIKDRFKISKIITYPLCQVCLSKFSDMGGDFKRSLWVPILK